MNRMNTLPKGENMARVDIQHCSGSRECVTTFHRTRDPVVALERALRLNFGVSAHFWREHGLGGDGVMYGQIGVPVRGQPRVQNLITGRVRIQVTT